jgi:putative FmdB family regulatory protein
MPIYEFRCQQCDERFEERRAMRDACSMGHPDAVRLLPVFATTGHAAPEPGCGAGGGCCGGACGAA